MSDVVCLGILVADVIAKPVDEWPERGKLVLVDQMELHSGGCAGNTAIGLNRIGIQAGLIGKVGDDGFGDFLIDFMKGQGIDTRGIVKDSESHTSATMVMVHGDGERSFVHYLGANARLSEADMDLGLAQEAKILHIAGSFLMPGFDGQPTAHVLRQAREMGLTTCLDTAWDSRGNWMKLLAPCLPFVDICLPSIEEARMLTGKKVPPDIAEALLARGVKTVGLKMGRAGCYLRTQDQEFLIPAYDISPMDATGAGDAFVAGFLTGVVKRWDLEETGRFANAVGAVCTLAMGTTDGIRSLEETKEFMSAHTTRTHGK